MLIKETFVIGDGVGEYPYGTDTIKDKLFANSRIIDINYNDTTIYPDVEFIAGNGHCTFGWILNIGDYITVSLYKY